MNPNYVIVIKHDLDKLFTSRFIAPIEKATLLSPNIVVLKKDDKLQIRVDFRKLNATTKKDPYLPFTKEVLDMVAGHEMYSFLTGFLGYHQIMIALENWYKTTFITDWGAFVWVIMLFGLKNDPPTYQRVVNMAFREYLGILMNLFLDDFNVFSDKNTHLQKLRLCFDRCCEFNIIFNPNKCMFLVYSRVILGYIVSHESKLSNPKKVLAIVNMSPSKTPKNI